jgi:transcriptional regulator with XRE-family HTH domain
MKVKGIKKVWFSWDIMVILCWVMIFNIVQLVKKMGVSSVIVWNWENGIYQPMPKNIGRLAKALKIEPIRLMMQGGRDEAA